MLRKIAIGFAAVTTTVIILLMLSIVSVGPAQTAVLYKRISGKTMQLGPGWHLVNPLGYRVVKYSLVPRLYSIKSIEGTWEAKDNLWIPTADGQRVALDVQVVYNLQDNKALDLFDQFGDRDIDYIEQNYLQPELLSQIYRACAMRQAIDVYGQQRNTIQEEVLENLRATLADKGLEVTNVLFRDVRMAPDILTAVQKKQQAAEEAIALQTEAEGRRQATILEATGQAEANRILADSLTGALLQLRTIEKLAPNVRVVIVPSDKNLSLLDLSTILQEQK